ncbi:MAG: hypothetical protein QXG03_09985 [Halalkalicoccus sp.]
MSSPTTDSHAKPERPPTDPPPRRVPGRKTRPAYTSSRRSWYGWGQTGSGEKSTFGQFLHDVPYVFAEISVFALPTLVWISATVIDGGFGVSGSAFVAWATMTLVATALHTGLVRPLATDTLGWVSLTPALVGLRLVYYNLAFLLAAYGSVALATLVGYLPVALAGAMGIAALAMLLFPRLAETVARRRAR